MFSWAFRWQVVLVYTKCCLHFIGRFSQAFHRPHWWFNVQSMQSETRVIEKIRNDNFYGPFSNDFSWAGPQQNCLPYATNHIQISPFDGRYQRYMVGVDINMTLTVHCMHIRTWTPCTLGDNPV
jgi:hypothetical protein